VIAQGQEKTGLDKTFGLPSRTVAAVSVTIFILAHKKTAYMLKTYIRLQPIPCQDNFEVLSRVFAKNFGLDENLDGSFPMGKYCA